MREIHPRCLSGYTVTYTQICVRFAWEARIERLQRCFCGFSGFSTVRPHPNCRCYRQTPTVPSPAPKQPGRAWTGGTNPGPRGHRGGIWISGLVTNQWIIFVTLWQQSCVFMRADCAARWSFLPLLIIHLTTSQQYCEPHCAEPCRELNGDVTAECGGCTSDGFATCYPGSPGFAGDEVEPKAGSVDTSDLQYAIREADQMSGEKCARFQSSNLPQGRWGQTTHLYRTAAAVKPVSPVLDCTNASVLSSLVPDCSEPESLERLAERGWVVIRGLAPQIELAKIRSRTKVESLCQPMLTETEEGRRACAYSSDTFREELPGLWGALNGLLGRWETNGIAAHAELGRGLALAPRESALSRLIQVRIQAGSRVGI